MVSNSSVALVYSMLFLFCFFKFWGQLITPLIFSRTDNSGLNCLRLFSLTNAIRTPNDCSAYFLPLHQRETAIYVIFEGPFAH